jgi:hypothetical protein
MRLRVFSAYCGSRTNYNASSERLEMLSLDEWMNLLDELDFFDEDFNRREVRQENEREGGEGGGEEGGAVVERRGGVDGVVCVCVCGVLH